MNGPSLPATGNTPIPPPASGAAPPVPCPHCQTVSNHRARFCSECGEEIGKPNHSAGSSSLGITSVPPEAKAGPAPSNIPTALATQPLLSVPPVPGELLDGPSSAAEQPGVRACACGRALAQDDQFCPLCGKPAPPTPRPLFSITYQSRTSPPCTIPVSAVGFTVGKDGQCDLTIPDDPYVSRQHARLSVEAGRCLIEDLKSSNGTYLRVRRPISLEPGDEVIVGTCTLKLERIGS